MRGCARPRAKQVHKPGFRHNRSFGGTATSAIRVFDKPRSNSSANSAGSFDYAYDDYGNQRYRYLSADHTKFWHFSWDGENRLRRAELTLGGQVVRALSFKYDPFGRRIEKKVEGLAPQVPVPLTTTYVYDGEDIVFTSVNDGTATTTTHYVHGPGIDEPLAMVANGQSYYYHADGLGSIVALTDAAKNVVQRYGYDSFGMVTAENPEFGNFYTFTGREWDREMGLYYYRARYYDPMEGRFISRDPIGFAGGDVNLYGYVGSNPVNWIDPFGLVEGSPANIARRKAIESAARGYVGGHAFDYAVRYSKQYPANSWKCSGFVCRVLNDTDVPLSVTPKGAQSRCATAGELANSQWNPNDWRILDPNEQPESGDIFAYKLTPSPGEPLYTGHTGIITSNGNVAAHENGVTERLETFVKLPTYRRYTGE